MVFSCPCSSLQLQELPANLTALTSLQELRVTDVANVPQHIISSGSASLLGHLGLAHHRVTAATSPGGQSNADERRLQIVTFGPKDSGKTQLLAQLTGKRFDIADPALLCVTVRWFFLLLSRWLQLGFVVSAKHTPDCNYLIYLFSHCSASMCLLCTLMLISCL